MIPLLNSGATFAFTDEGKGNNLNGFFFVSISNFDDTHVSTLVLKTNNQLRNIVVTEQDILDVLSNLVINQAMVWMKLAI